jgi:broad specificity phosphatase PhoE
MILREALEVFRRRIEAMLDRDGHPTVGDAWTLLASDLDITAETLEDVATDLMSDVWDRICDALEREEPEELSARIAQVVGHGVIVGALYGRALACAPGW